MTRSRRQAGNGLVSGYKKAEEVARKKVVYEFEAIEILGKHLLAITIKNPGPKGTAQGLRHRAYVS